MSRRKVLVIRLSYSELRALELAAGPLPISTWARAQLVKLAEPSPEPTAPDPRQLALDALTRKD